MDPRGGERERDKEKDKEKEKEEEEKEKEKEKEKDKEQDSRHKAGNRTILDRQLQRDKTKEEGR